MRTTLAALASASVAFASVTPPTYGEQPPAYGSDKSSSSSSIASSSKVESFSSIADAVTSSAAPSGTPDFPSCWSACFKKSGVTSPEETCDNEDLSDCIDESCSDEEADKYNSWLAKECGSSSTSSNVVGPTGSTSMSHGPSGYVSSSSLTGPHGPSSYPVSSSSYPVTSSSYSHGPSSYPIISSSYAHGPSSGYVPSSSGSPGGYGNCTTTYSSVCTETETKIYRSTTEFVPTVITHIFTTNLPSGSCSGVKYPITSSSSIPAYPVTSSTAGSPNQPSGGYGNGGDGPKTTVTDIETIYTTVCPGTETSVSEGQTITKTYDTTSVVTTTVPVTVTVPATTASPSDFPSCWNSCFQKTGASSKEEACKPEVGKCIDSTCSAEESAAFDAWAQGFCVAETTTSDVPVGPVTETSSTEGSPVTDSTPTSTPTGSCSDNCYKQNGVTSKEEACKPEVGKCIDENCSADESASFDAWAVSFCVESGNGGDLPSEPAGGNNGGNGGVPTEYTSIKPVTKPFQFGEWTSYYTDFETVTLTSYLTETAAVPTGGYGSGDDGNTEGSPTGPATTAPPNGGYGGHQTTKTCEYETEVTTAYTTVCPATESDGMTTSTVTTTSTKTMTFTITTTDYPEQTSSSTQDGQQPPYPTGPSSPSGGYGTGTGVYPTGGYGSVTSSSMTSSTPAGPTGTPSIPSCWAKCFAKYDVESEHELCGDINVETCIKAECPLDSYNAYEGWLNDYCGAGSTTSSSGVVGPTGSGYPHPSDSGVPHPTGSGVPHPTGTGVGPTGTGVGPTGTSGPTGTESSSCALPTPTKACKRCEGQPGTDKYCGLDINTNIYKDGGAPITCNTVEYNWEITTGNVSPDGVERWAILINGQTPGPMLEANWGDEIIVHVKNSMPASDLNGTTIHWHGIHQKGTPEYDGVPSLTQCPIAPGDTFTYKFKAAQFGSSWYHSHFALQAYDGLYGPMVIHGPVQDGIEYDGEEFVALQDWMHTPLNYVYHALELVQNGQRSSPTLQNGLINGKNTWENGGERWSMTVTKGKTYRLRVLNAAIQSTFKFYIDGHSFKVIAADFVPIVPYETNIINLNNGQRYDIIFTADQPSANYWMRSDVQAPCSNVTNGLDVKAILHYDDAPEGTPTSQGYQYQPECIDEPMASLVPIVPWNAGAESSEISKDVLIVPNGATPNLFKWTLSGTAFFSQWSDPTLQSIYDDGTVPTYSGDLAIREDNLGEWIYVIIDSVIPLPHPIHLHGHDFLILDQGLGTYDASTASLNLQNPPRRDTAIMPHSVGQGPPQGGYLVVAFYTDNPGVWLMHCHIGWHNSMGFALQIIEGLEDIKDTVEYPCQMEETCDAWHQYVEEYGITVTDSGV